MESLLPDITYIISSRPDRSKRTKFLLQTVKVSVHPDDDAANDVAEILPFYTTCIRPVLEYTCPGFHHSLPQYLSNEMERLQKRALRIMQPDFSYAEALVALDITSLYERRKALSNAWKGPKPQGP